MKRRRINLTKEINLYTETLRHLWNYLKAIIGGGKNSMYSWAGRINVVKMFMVLKTQIQWNSYYNTNNMIQSNRKVTINICMAAQQFLNSQSKQPGKRCRTGGSIPHEFKIQCKTIATKAAWQWCENWKANETRSKPMYLMSTQFWQNFHLIQQR